MSDRQDRHPDRPDERLGLEAFDAVEAPDQWADISRRADGAELAAAEPVAARRSPAAWFMAAAAVALVAVAAVAVAVRSDDDSAPTPFTVPSETVPSPPTEPSTVPATVPATDVPSTTSATTVPATDAPSTTSATTVPPTTTITMAPAAAVTVWDPDCVDLAGGATPPPAVDPAAARFTTVAAAPTLDIVLPTLDADSGVEPPLVSTVVVPGGVALTAHGFAADAGGGDGGDGGGGPVATVVVVDLDGTVRWRRCFDDVGWPRALIVGGPQLWLAAGDGEALLLPFDLATGADGSATFDIGDRTIDGVLGAHLLVGVPWDAEPVGPDDRLGIVDLATSSVTDVPYPELAFGRPSDAVRYQLVTADGGPLLAATSSDANAAEIVWTGDAWSTDPDDLRRLPPTLRIPYGDDAALELRDGAGDLVWSEPGFRHISREGFASAMSDTVALVMECRSWTEDLGCAWADENTPPDEQLVAFDLATGTRLWERPGGQAFAAIDADRGIVTDDVGWELIDLRTGERVDDVAVVSWPEDDIFLNECCGAGDYVWTRRDGGVLFESIGDRLHVWLAPELSTPTVTVDAFR